MKCPRCKSSDVSSMSGRHHNHICVTYTCSECRFIWQKVTPIPMKQEPLFAPAQQAVHPALLLLIFATVTAITQWLVGCFGWTGWDDAFITYRFAYNNAHGLWWTWNASEGPIYGTTSMTYTMILTALAWLRIPLDGASLVIGFICHVLTAFMGYHMVRRATNSNLGAIATGLFISADAFGIWATLGMETYFFILLVLLTVWSFEHWSDWWTGTLMAAVVLTRLDGMALFGAMAVVAILKRRSAHFAVIGVPWILVGAWMIFADSYFGSWIPHSMAAKQIQANELIMHPLRWTGFTWFTGKSAWMIIIPGITAAISSVLIAIGRKGSVMPVILFLFAAANYSAYVITKMPGFSWYLIPVWTCLIVLAGVWIGTLHSVTKGSKAIATVLIVLVGIGIITVGDKIATRSNPITEDGYSSLHDIAGVLNEQARPGDQIVMEAIGIVGYKCPQLTVHDCLGLCCDHFIAPLRERRLLQETQRTNPEWLLILEKPKHRAFVHSQLVSRWTKDNYDVAYMEPHQWARYWLMRHVR